MSIMMESAPPNGVESHLDLSLHEMAELTRSDSGNVESSPLLSLARNPSVQNDVAEISLEDPDFAQLLYEIHDAIAQGIYPTRISQGSSGSYFVRDTNNKIVGVFKPKDEEPYGHLNPKWTKWLHKTCCPCLFGRSCLVPNQGYLSEAGASLVDEKLQLYIVPKTKVVRLASPTFHYDPATRFFRRNNLPSKVGSLQTFVNGFKDAEQVVDQFSAEECDPQLKADFRREFEKLVVLDYITRNTDRGNDNWLLKIEDARGSSNGGGQQHSRVRLAAIDNGLSFPFKHPDSWRTYPYYWAWLPQAKVAFSDEICDRLLPVLADENFVENMIDDIYQVFKKDSGFSKSHFKRQAGVMRGQILNLVKALRDRKTPLGLVQMPVCVIQKKGHSRLQRFRSQYPIFSWC